MTVPLGHTRWECASKHCGEWAITVDDKIPYHRCGELGGIMVPLVRVGLKATHRLIERQDNVGGEMVQDVTDKNGRLLMAVETHHDDGYDTTVYPPTATANVDERHE